jgi:multicomponent Na+:H+ antiporter subunit B
VSEFDEDGAAVAGSDEDAAEELGPRQRRETTVIARTVVRVVVPIIVLTAIAFLLQGHNRPGGGFIGGVLTVTAFVLVYVIFGLEYLQTTLLDVEVESSDVHRPVSAYRWLFAVGLALAAGSGLVPILLGLPFLTQAVYFAEGIPLYGELEVASAFAFDIGVYLTVVGGLLTIVGEVGSE